MRRLLLTALIALAACQGVDDPDRLPEPTGLEFELVPSGEPDMPAGVILRWDDLFDDRVTAYVVYSRYSLNDQWHRRAETTSPSFHDAGIPALQYHVKSRNEEGDESGASNVVTIDTRLRYVAPTALNSITLHRAVQLSWSAASRQSRPSDDFGYYRVYSSLYQNGRCAEPWYLEGTTASDDFLVTGLTNGVRYCFAVSIVSYEGYESLWSAVRDDTPRYDARNVIIDSFESAPASSGFDFLDGATGQLGVVGSGTKPGTDFRIEKRADGLLYFVPQRSDVSIALYSSDPVTDLTSIDIAPLDNVFSTSPISVSPGYAYVFRIGPVGSGNYGAVRVTHAGANYVILDWSYQSAPNNPELSIGR